MRILIDIGHPAHVHYFRFFHETLRGRGHELLVVARDKDVAHELLRGFGIPFVSRGRGRDSTGGKLVYMLWADAFMVRQALRFRPDAFVSYSSPYAAHAAAVLRRPHIAFDDTESARLARRLYAPLTDVILSPACFRGPALPRQRRFDGFMELLYLRPDRFTPDPSILECAGLAEGEAYAFVRFVSWNATHDLGRSGMPLSAKRQLVERLSALGRVVISAEGELPPDLEAYRARVDPTHIHHLLSFARVCVGESATMSAEAAVLGTPAVYVDTVGRGYTDALEGRFGLVYNHRPDAKGLEAAVECASALLAEDRTAEFRRRRDALLNETIDVNALLLDVVSELVAGNVD